MCYFCQNLQLSREVVKVFDIAFHIRDSNISRILKNCDYDGLFCNFGIVAVLVAIALHQISSRCLMFDEQMMVTEYFPVRKGYNLCKVMLNIYAKDIIYINH